MFFVKTSEINNIEEINKSVIKAGFLNKLGNKGYIIYEYKYKNKTFSFCTGHLEAGEKDKNYQSRVDQLVDILVYKSNKSPNRIFQNAQAPTFAIHKELIIKNFLKMLIK